MPRVPLRLAFEQSHCKLSASSVAQRFAVGRTATRRRLHKAVEQHQHNLSVLSVA